MIKARLQGSSELWVSMNILVMNLVRMGDQTPILFFVLLIERMEGMLDDIFFESKVDGPVGYPPPGNQFLFTY